MTRKSLLSLLVSCCVALRCPSSSFFLSLLRSRMLEFTALACVPTTPPSILPLSAILSITATPTLFGKTNQLTFCFPPLLVKKRKTTDPAEDEDEEDEDEDEDEEVETTASMGGPAAAAKKNKRTFVPEEETNERTAKKGDPTRDARLAKERDVPGGEAIMDLDEKRATKSSAAKSSAAAANDDDDDDEEGEDEEDDDAAAEGGPAAAAKKNKGGYVPKEATLDEIEQTADKGDAAADAKLAKERDVPGGEPIMNLDEKK